MNFKEFLQEKVGEPEEGWCLVMANNKVTGTIMTNKSDAVKQQKLAPVHTTLKYGKRLTSDGEYVATRAVNP